MEKEQIVKALECCTRGRKSKDDRPCFECPYNECNLVGGTGERQISGTCQGWLMKDTLSLIREQEKRIEELEAENEKLKKPRYMVRSDGRLEMIPSVESVRNETVRKMQEDIKERCIKGGIYPAFVKNVIETVAKEIVEGHGTPPETCTSCGDVIPEGRQVCPNCENTKGEAK